MHFRSNDKKISEHKGKPLYKIVGINSTGSSTELMSRLAPIFEKHHHTRHLGANALEMAMVAEGLIDVFIDLRKKIRIQDLAAGYLLVKEAGGLILDENFQPLDSDLNYETRLSFIAAANKEILDRSEEHTSELQSRRNLVCRLLLEKKKHY